MALETLKLALSTDNRARDSLVGAALAAGLLPKLLAKLDWRKDSASGNFGEEEVCTVPQNHPNWLICRARRLVSLCRYPACMVVCTANFVGVLSQARDAW